MGPRLRGDDEIESLGLNLWPKRPQLGVVSGLTTNYSEQQRAFAGTTALGFQRCLGSRAKLYAAGRMPFSRSAAIT